jgi:hypothetical protein
VCVRWNSVGDALEFAKRPIVLSRTVRDAAGRVVRDEFPPRWLILTRLEPEQYAGTWDRDAKIWDGEYNRFIQIQPSEPPKEKHLWFMTIAEHDEFCCGYAAREDRSCYGRYAPPGKCLEELRRIRKGIEAMGMRDAPFDSPDRLTQKLRDKSVNNYIEQSMREYDEQAKSFIDVIPFGDLRQVMNTARERELDRIERRMKQGV